jgi:hypothetical protein
METAPESGRRNPMIVLKRVDFPLPLTPTSAQMVPDRRRKLASRTAT